MEACPYLVLRMYVLSTTMGTIRSEGDCSALGGTAFHLATVAGYVRSMACRETNVSEAKNTTTSQRKATNPTPRTGFVCKGTSDIGMSLGVDVFGIFNVGGLITNPSHPMR